LEKRSLKEDEQAVTISERLEMSCPKLTHDVERLIFEVAAKWPGVKPTRICNLMLVARRVHAWLEPFLYESIHITKQNIDPALQAMASKPPDFLRANVKTLMLDNTSRRSTEEILRMCPGVIKLDFTNCLPFRILAHLRPRQLCLMLSRIEYRPEECIFDLPFLRM
jgi:hypothetical protein